MPQTGPGSRRGPPRRAEKSGAERRPDPVQTGAGFGAGTEKHTLGGEALTIEIALYDHSALESTGPRGSFRDAVLSERPDFVLRAASFFVNGLFAEPPEPSGPRLGDGGPLPRLVRPGVTEGWPAYHLKGGPGT